MNVSGCAKNTTKANLNDFCFYFEKHILDYDSCAEPVAMRLDELNETFALRCL